MLSLTIFNSIFDNKTNKTLEFESFDKFEDMLYKLSKEPKKSKKDAVLFSPAIYEEDTTRANKNVIRWDGWCCVDVDDYEFEGDLKDDLVRRFHEYRSVLSSHLRKRCRTLGYDHFGTLSSQNWESSEINRLRTYLACITSLQYTIIALTLSSVILGTALMLYH